MLEGTSRVKIYNQCKYNIGLTLLNGVQILIRPNSFQIATLDDILYIESTYSNRQYFSAKKLVAYDNTGKIIDFSEYGFAIPDNEHHHNDEEIISMLKQGPKKIEAWLDTINDKAELHAIYEVAIEQDLPASKLKVLASKIPDKDWLGNMMEI